MAFNCNFGPFARVESENLLKKGEKRSFQVKKGKKRSGAKKKEKKRKKGEKRNPGHPVKIIVGGAGLKKYDL